MNKKPLLIAGIAMLVCGGAFTMVVSVMRASNVKLSQSGFDGDSSILAGALIAMLGLIVSIYATAKKIDLGPVEIDQAESAEPMKVEPPIAQGEQHGNPETKP